MAKARMWSRQQRTGREEDVAKAMEDGTVSPIIL